MLSAVFIIRTYSIGRMDGISSSVQCKSEKNFSAVGPEFSKTKLAELTDVHVSSLCAFLQTIHSKNYSYTS
jgi:hypothetical protein